VIRSLLEIAGIMVFAASGVLSAGRKGMDLVGVAVIAVVTALGGGTLRDLLLERHPVAWIANTSYLWACLAASALTLLYVRFREPPARALAVADALGLALFTIGGAQIAQQAGASGLIMVLMGVMTGTAGGVLRDVLSAEVPLIFRSGQLYASAALGGAVMYHVLDRLGVARDVAGLAGMTVIAALRLGAIIYDWRLPTPRLPRPS
jgi:uncharacterized membrane protein YeiH